MAGACIPDSEFIGNTSAASGARDADLGFNPETFDQLQALRILHRAFGRSPGEGAPALRPSPCTSGFEVVEAASPGVGDASLSTPRRGGAKVPPCPGEFELIEETTPRSLAGHAAADAPIEDCQNHELHIDFEGLPFPVRLLEAIDTEEATRQYRCLGEEDPFGSKVWPAAYLCAERLLREGVRCRSVLELGCGTGLVSIVALLGGAAVALATDRCRPNVDRAVASARLNGVELQGQVFDVLCDKQFPVPQASTIERAAGSRAMRVFDFLVFSDVLYWAREAAAFGRRAAEAYAAGTTVIVADPGRRRDDFLAALRSELQRRGVEPLPCVEPVAANCPERIFKWISAEVRVASSLFCEAPFVLVLRPPDVLAAAEVIDIADVSEAHHACTSLLPQAAPPMVMDVVGDDSGVRRVLSSEQWPVHYEAVE
mmetsp:Transcript_21375/g.59678  ORF Transcript_21375/g.59678 Transcript_21375/m.59678 type:complete len:428 (+) Transcript_21375:79-1362(+)